MNSPFMGQQVGNWSICHAIWAKRKPIVHPTLYPTHISFIPSQSNLPIPKIWLLKNWPWKSKVKVMGEVKVQSHNSGPTSYGFTSFYVNPPSYSWDRVFFKLTVKIQGQSHSSRSHNRYNILSPHIPFIPCWSALPFLRCSYLKNWPWKSKVKVMGDVKVQSHNVSLTFYRLTSLSFHVNLASHCWVTTFSNFTLKFKGQDHRWGHSSKSQYGYDILSTHIPIVPCQSALPFLRYSIFKIWPWKSRVKVMGEVTV